MDNYIGKRLDGRYEIQEIIGVGGMAIVYKAYDNIDDRIVAIKILKDEFLANEEFRRRFKNESKAVAVLSHQNIVKVFGVSFGDKLQYIVMEYIDGITLKEYIQQQGGLNWKEVVHFTSQILRALQHAHDKGIVHRDVKPQNIMLLPTGNIKVTDFGIARFSRSETRTMTEKAIGSVHYISPEQARGDIADEKSDIYSVGIMMYEMLTGQLPFQSDTAVSVAIMQIQAQPARPRDIKGDIAVGLEQITMHAINKSPVERYQSAASMLRDIDTFKNNPNIIFEYSYFVDSQPTKYIDDMNIPPVSQPSYDDNQYYQNTPVYNPVNQNPVDDNSYYEQEKPNKTKTVQVLTAVAISSLLILIIFLIVVIGGGFGKSTINCPDLLGKIYEDVIDDSRYDDFKIVKEGEEYNSEYAAGEICEQSPTPDKKVKEGTIISVVVSLGENLVEVPDVSGILPVKATDQLKAAGFDVTLQDAPSDEVEEGLVIKTVPEAGEMANEGSIITIYVSVGSVGEVVPVPDLTNLTKEQAEKVLETNGLVLGKVETKPSAEPEDTVIDQNPKNIDVEKGSAVDIVCSDGTGIVKNVSISVVLPTSVENNNETGSLKVFVDNTEYEDLTSTVKLSGATKSLSISAAGTAVAVEVTVDQKTIYTATIDFKEQRISSEKKTTYIKIPSFVGENYNDVKDKYKSYFDIVINEKESDKDIGTVISQSTSSGYAVKGSTLTLDVSKGKPTTTVPPTTETTTTPTTEAQTEVAPETSTPEGESE